MENASKALVIAGAIILVIVLITLGYNVIKNNSDIINKGNTDQAQVEAFNSEFENYAGSGKKASDVRNLCSKVFAKNGTETKNQTNHTITLTYENATGNTSAISSIPTDLNNGIEYTIELTYDSSTGYINAIEITH